MQFTAVKLGNAVADGQPQTGAVLSSGAGFIHHKESLGNALKIFFGNADALIPHGDAVAVLLLFAGKEDDLAGFTGFAGIVNKIGKHGQQKIFFIKDQLLLDTRGKSGRSFPA